MTGPVPRGGHSAIAPYVPGKARAEGLSDIVKLSANENAFGASPRAIEACRAASDELHLYPDMHALRLRQAVAKRFDIEPERLIFGAGSDEIFAFACQTYLEPGDNAVQPQYGFAAWEITVKAAGGKMRSAPETNYHVDVDALLDRVDDRTRIVFVANPANPTGTRIAFTEIERLHAALPERVLLILDGAYAEFAEDKTDYSDGMALAQTAPNVLVTRTFSKLYGLAALRLGWGYASPEIITAMERIRLPFNTTGPAHAAALAALEDEAFLSKSLAHVARERAALEEFFKQAGFETLPSSANFVTVKCPDDGALKAAAIERALSERGVLVRALTNYGMPDFLRVTIGSGEALRRFREAFSAIVTAA